MGEARDNILLYRLFQQWRRSTAAHQTLYHRVAILAESRMVRSFFRNWRSRMRQKQQQDWRMAMRTKMAMVRRKREDRLKREVWSIWRRSHQFSQAGNRYDARLVLQNYMRWKARLAHVEELVQLGDVAIRDNNIRLVEQAWNIWVRSTQLRSAENLVSNRVGQRVKVEIMETWVRRS